MKTCGKCGGEFDGRYCPACKKAIAAAYYVKEREKVVARNLAWRAANPEAVKAIRVAGYSRNRDRHLAATEAWRRANPDKVNAYRLSYIAMNRVAVRARNAAWHAANPMARRRHEHNRRSKASGRLSPGLARALFALQRGKCACCRKPLGKDFHMDHIMPIALGGLNEDSNMQLLRPLCNMQKYAKHPAQFMRERGFLL